MTGFCMPALNLNCRAGQASSGDERAKSLGNKKIEIYESWIEIAGTKSNSRNLIALETLEYKASTKSGRTAVQNPNLGASCYCG